MASNNIKWCSSKYDLNRHSITNSHVAHIRIDDIVIICILDFLITNIFISYIAEKQNITIDKGDAHEHQLLFGHSCLETMINTNDNCSDMKWVDNIFKHNLALEYYGH